MRSRPPEVPPAELRVRPRMAPVAQPRQVRGVVRPAAPQRHDVVHPRARQRRPRAAAQHGDDGSARRAPSALPTEHGLPRPRPRGVAVRGPPRLRAPVAARAPAPRSGRHPPAASPAERPRLSHGIASTKGKGRPEGRPRCGRKDEKPAACCTAREERMGNLAARTMMRGASPAAQMPSAARRRETVAADVPSSSAMSLSLHPSFA